VLAILPVLGCASANIIEPDGDPDGNPDDWPVYYGPAGGTVEITFTADVYLHPEARFFIEFQSNTNKTWWDPVNNEDPTSRLVEGWQTLTWVQNVAVDDDQSKIFTVVGYEMRFDPDPVPLAESRFWVKSE
jgi:hypothetical protein